MSIIWVIILSACYPATKTSHPHLVETMPGEAVESAPDQWLHFGLDGTDINTMDPHFAVLRQERIIMDMVLNGLVRYMPGNMPALKPDLVVEIPEPLIEDGKQVWTFQLRQGVMCQPGPLTDAYELTAEDVVYSLEKSADTNRSAFAGDYAGMTFKVIDSYHLSITLEKPQSIYLFLPKIENYAGGFIVCKQAVEAMGDEAFSKHPIGTGPFQFQTYIPNEKVSLVSN